MVSLRWCEKNIKMCIRRGVIRILLLFFWSFYLLLCDCCKLNSLSFVSNKVELTLKTNVLLRNNIIRSDFEKDEQCEGTNEKKTFLYWNTCKHTPQRRVCASMHNMPSGISTLLYRQHPFKILRTFIQNIITIF